MILVVMIDIHILVIQMIGLIGKNDFDQAN